MKNIIILQNSWATDAVYALLDDEMIKQKSGFFIQDDVDRLWKNKDYPFHHHALMALMEKFELCCKLVDQAQPTWLAPQLLPIALSDLDWNKENNLTIRYIYDFMPKGIVARLIVRLNRYIKDLSMAWRSGVVLARENTRALVTETYSRKEIVVNVSGESPKEMMTIITEEIDQINGTYQFLNFEKMIPCNCHICQQQPDPNFYKYNNLKERLRKNKATVECERSYNDVNVGALLEGVFTKVVGKKYKDMKVFISYAHKDDEYRQELQAHLKSLKLTHHLKVWDDSELFPGDNWEEEVRMNIRSADILLFLISSDFMNSKERGLNNIHNHVV